MAVEVIAHNIRSLYNVGSFFRNADAFGVAHLYLTGYTGTPPRSEIAKVSLGAEEMVSWSHTREALPLIERLKSEGKRIVALESDPGFQTIDALKREGDMVLLFGNEPDGLDDVLMQAATDRCRIPMRGTKTSLNVAVACGVALYAVTQSRV